jgi:hypothetical protein
MNDALNGSPWPAELPAAEQQKMVQITRDAWRELGFWYECDVREMCWRFRADRRGIASLISAVRKQLTSIHREEKGEHLHLGPYSTLSVISWDGPLISRRGIAGRPEDFERLMRELEALQLDTTPRTCAIAAEFAGSDGFRAELTIEPEGFDPAKADLTIANELES